MKIQYIQDQWMDKNDGVKDRWETNKIYMDGWMGWVGYTGWTRNALFTTNSNNNNHSNAWFLHGDHIHGHFESSPGLFDECRLIARWSPTLRPSSSAISLLKYLHHRLARSMSSPVFVFSLSLTVNRTTQTVIGAFS